VTTPSAGLEGVSSVTGRTYRYRRFRYPEYVYAAILLAPSLILFLTFVIGPMFFGLLISVTNYDILAGSSGWVGFANYGALFSDPEFHQALWNTVLLFAEVVPATILISFVVACLLNLKLPGRLIFRTAFFLPLVSAAVAVATIFRFVFYQNGPINSLLGTQIPFLSRPEFALLCLSVILIWTLVPLNVVFYLAALQAVGQDLVDAAALDGAGGIQTARHITWPLVLPTTIFVAVINITSVAIGSFDIVYVLTKGGPLGSTTTVVYLLYRRAFVDFDLPSASAIGFLLAVILLAITRLLLIYETAKRS
jgi:multiple sugar transport system permease protein